jgi:AcrR family transcriptional regulator
MNKRREQGLATREHLVAVATALFAERGYEATSIEAVLETAGVSRGSLYHHFANKEALFEAVLRAVEVRIGAETMAAVVGATDADDSLRRGCLAWMQMASDPVVRRIVLIDAPAVLTWRRWREIEEEFALGNIKGAMRLAAHEGRVPRDLVDAFSHMLLATMNELAHVIVRSPDPVEAQRMGELAIDEFLSRLLDSPGSATGS